MEKILSITEVENITKEDLEQVEYSSYDGFRILTDKQEIFLLINNQRGCCEQWGYFMSEDDTKEFVDKNLLNITLTDTGLKTRDIVEHGLDEGNVMFVNLETDGGTLQFTAYNSHNGYYGHEAIVVSNQLNHEVTL